MEAEYKTYWKSRLIFYLTKSRRKIIVFLIVVSVLLCNSWPALAVKKFTVKPKISASWLRESNYYKTETDERAVETYDIRPGIELGYETPKSMLYFGYTMSAKAYRYETAGGEWQYSSDKKKFTGHSAELRARTKPFDRLTLGLDDSVFKTRDSAYLGPFATVDTPYMGPYSTTVDQEEYVINNLTLSVYYEFGSRFSSRLRYVNTKTDYARSIYNDSTEHRGIFNLIYGFSRRSSIDLEFQHWVREYKGGSSDYTSDQVNLVLRKQIKHFSFEGECGYHKRSFNKKTPEDLGTTDYLIEVDDMSELDYLAAVTWQNPPAPVTNARSNLLFMSPTASTRVSSYDMYYPASLPRTYMVCAVKQNLNDDAATGDNYFNAMQFTTQAGHIFMDKILVNLAFNYQSSDYKTRYGAEDNGDLGLREDGIFRYSGSIGYRLKDWLTIDLTGGYETRDSNLAGYDYNNTYIMLKCDIFYDFGRR